MFTKTIMCKFASGGADCTRKSLINMFMRDKNVLFNFPNI